MHWLIETCVLSDERISEFRSALDASGCRSTFTLDVDQPPELRRPRPAPGASVIAYGSKSIIPYARRMDWRPGVWSSPAFDYANVQRELGALFLNASARIAPFSDVEATAEGRGWRQVFVRPADDNKAFAGIVLELADLPAWRSRLLESGYLTDITFDVVVAETRQLEREWRIVLADANIAGACLYRENDEKTLSPGCPKEVADVALSAAARYQPAPVFVADVAEFAGNNFAIIEYNAFNSADLYACDIDSIVEHVTKVAQHQGS